MKKIITFSSLFGLLFLKAVNTYAADIEVKIPKPPGVQQDLGVIIGGVVYVVLIIAGLATFIFLIWGGIQWITSGGDKSGVEAAQHKIQAAILGLFIVFATWALMFVIEQFLGISILRGIKIPSIGG